MTNETSTSEHTTKSRKKGAQSGNMNAFKNGTSMLTQAMSGKAKPRRRRITERTTTELIEHCGGDEVISTPKKFIAGIAGAQLGRYDSGKRAYNHILKKAPKILENLAALAKLD